MEFDSKHNKVEFASTGTLYDMEFANNGIWPQSFSRMSVANSQDRTSNDVESLNAALRRIATYLYF